MSDPVRQRDCLSPVDRLRRRRGLQHALIGGYGHCHPWPDAAYWMLEAMLNLCMVMKGTVR